MRALIGKALLAAVCASVVLSTSAALAQNGDQPDNAKAELYYNVGKQFFDKGLLKDAKQNLLLALEANANHQKAKTLLATVKGRLGEKDVGKEDYDDFIQRVRADERARKEHRARLADYYYTAAKKRFDERRYEEAEKNLEGALTAVPRHKEARALLARVRRVLQKDDSGQPSMIDMATMKRRIWRSYALAEMRKNIVDAKQLLDEKNFSAALGKLRTAESSAKVLSTHLDVRRELTEIKGLSEDAQVARDKALKEGTQARLAKAVALAERERERLGELRQQRINRLLDDAKELFDNTRYLLAAKKAEEILKIEPRHKEVGAFLDKCHEMQVDQRMKWYARTMATETEKTWREVSTLSIPFSGWRPLYPDNWDEIRKRRAGEAIGGEAPEAEEWRKKLEAKLEEPVSFDFIATPLDDVVAFLRNLKKVNIVVDKKALEGNENLDVTLRLDKVRFKDALEWILRLVDLKYTLDNEVVYISTAAKIKQTRRTVTRYYDVSDLTVKLSHFKPNLRAISNQDLDDADQMEDIFGEDPEVDDHKPETFTGDSLVEFIKRVIAPNTWDDDLGGDDIIP